MGDAPARWNIVDTATPVDVTPTVAPEPSTGEKEAHRWNIPAGTTLTADSVWVGETGPRGPAGPSGAPGLDVTQDPYNAIGDGVTDDTAAIQAAVDACETAGGGMVWFPPGTYLISDSLDIPDFTTLAGCGALSVIKLADDSDCHMVSIASGVNDVLIRDLKLDGNGANQTTLDGDGDTVNCVQVVSAARITLDNVEVADACDTGIHIADDANAYTTDVVIHRSYIHGSGTQCMRARFTERLSLLGCHLYDWANAAAANAAIVTTMAGEARNWRVSGNHFQNVSGTQFAIEVAGTGGLVDSVIAGNLFDSNALQGGGVSGYFFRCAMTGNIHTNGYGDHRSGYEVVGTDNVVADNVIENGSIALGTNAGFTAGRNTVRGNRISNSTASSYLIWFGGSGGAMNDVSVCGNGLQMTAAAGSTGIDVGAYGDAGVVTNVFVSGNTISGNANCAGIYLQGANGSSGINVCGNAVTGCGYGVLLPDTSNHDEVTITGNDVRNNSTPVQNLTTGGTIRINNNILADNQAHAFSGGLEVTGDRSDGVALTNLLTALETMGLITDSTTA